MISATPVTAYLALGSNLGDRAALLNSAIQSLRDFDGIEVIAISRIIETEPVGALNQSRYLNAAMGIRTTMTAQDLLRACLAIEQQHGRTRTDATRWGPRRLDIDLLLFGDAIIDEPGPPRLRVPHPHMHTRRFVLAPLAEIAPDLIHPTLKKAIRTILVDLPMPAME